MYYNSAVLYLDDTAKKYPNKIAIEEEENVITFDELRTSARAIGSLLIDKCRNVNLPKTSPIIVYMPKSIKNIISFMGVLYSGNFYVPIDEKMPIPRLTKIIENLSPAWIITDYDNYDKLIEAGFYSDRILIFDEIVNSQIDDDYIDQVVSKVLDTDPIYIVYTSGSTGVPKGVVVPHSGVVDYAAWVVNTFGIDENTVMGNQAPFYFDNSVLDIYGMLASGAKMVIIPEVFFQFPVKLPDYIESKKITFIFWVPTVIINVANSGILEGFKFNHLEKVLFCGETMPNKQLNIWRKHNPDFFYANLYGPSEITDVCTYFVVERDFNDEEPLPIGIACKNMRTYILNDKDELAQMNEIGELCVTGTGLSLGYYNAPDISEKVFIQNPTNKFYAERMYRTGDLAYVNDEGLIIFIGRKDSQIKHGGNRIELGEIETIAKSLKGVENACVLYNQEAQEIVLFIESPVELNSRILLKSMRELLPKYMIPGKVKQMEKLPLNTNGKIDRVLLKTYLNE